MINYDFKGKERQKTLEQLVFIYESQIMNIGNPEYIKALAELIKEKYEEQGMTDFELEPESGSMDDRNLGMLYELFEQKVNNIINTHERGDKWVPNKKAVPSFRN